MSSEKSEKDYLSEFEKSVEFLKAAENNLKLNDIKTAANREYFSAERAVVALLNAKFGLTFKDHKKIWDSSKLVDVKMYHLLRELYDLRLQADYSAASKVTELTHENVKLYLEKVRELISTIKVQLDTK